MSADEVSVERPSLAALTWESFKIGCLGFGGPAGQIALMHRIFVEERHWIDEPRYLHALNYCMLLPGPEAQQLATYIGWLLHGVRGGVIAGLLFVLPGALLIFALAWLYVLHAGGGIAAALLFGVKAAVIGFLIEALVKIGKRALKTRTALVIALAAFVALAVADAPFPFVILAAATFGVARSWLNRGSKGEAPAPSAAGPATAAPSVTRAMGAALVWGALWAAPVAAALILLGPDHLLVEVGLFFSQLAVITFGGAYAVLAYLQQYAVETQGWLSNAEMIDALGLAETTPGPLILVNNFVGFLAGWNGSGGSLGLAAAAMAMAAWCTFAPSFVWIFAGAPFAERLRRSAIASSALAAVTAAVLGVVAKLALFFALHVLFAETTKLEGAWGRLELPVLQTLQPLAALIAIASAVALMRFKVNAALVVLGAAAIGFLASQAF